MPRRLALRARAACTVFRIRGDGTMAFSRGRPMAVSTTRNLFWMGMAP